MAFNVGGNICVFVSMLEERTECSFLRETLCENLTEQIHIPLFSKVVIF